MISVMQRLFHCSLRFSTGLFLSECTKDFKHTYKRLCRHLQGALCTYGTYFDKIGEIGLKLALVEKC